MSVIRVQAIISGYQGKAVNLLGAMHTETGLFIVAKEQALTARTDGALTVSNNGRLDDRDRLFDEDKLQRAIRLYFSLKGQGLLELLPEVQKHDPAQRIQVDGMNDRGTRYGLSDEITNGHVAVLAMLEAADLSTAADTTSETAADITGMYAELDEYDPDSADWLTI